MKTSVQKYLAVITRADGKVPSTVVVVNASTAAVAVKRAQMQAQAQFPRYTKFDITVDTITPRKIKRFNREFKNARAELQEAVRNCDYWNMRISAKLHRTINFGLPWVNSLKKAWLQQLRTWQKVKALPAQLEVYWLQMIELNDVINAE